MRAAMALLGVCLLLTAVGLGWWAPIERKMPVQARIESPSVPETVAITAAPIALEPVREEPQPQVEPDGTLFYTSANVRLRSGPSSNFSIVWTAPVGTQVRSIQVDGNWHFVQAADYEGWMYNRYLSDAAP